MSQPTEEVHGRIGEAHLGSGTATRLGHVLIASRHHLLGQHAVQHSIQVARLHLPHVHGAIGAADNQKVVQRSPFDAHHREEVATGQSHTLFLRQAEQRHRVIRGDGANAFLDAGLKREEQRLNLIISGRYLIDTYAAIIRRHQQLGDLSSMDTEAVQQSAAVQVPQTDCKVHASRHQMGLVVTGMG